MKVQQIEEFSRIGGESRPPSATENNKVLTWNNDTEKFIYNDVNSLIDTSIFLDPNVGGWRVDADSLFTGTKQPNDDYTTNGITLYSNGTEAAIRAKDFRIDTDGSCHFKGILESPSGRFGDENNGIDFGITAPNTLTIRGAVVQSPSGAVSPMAVFRGQYQNTATYHNGDEVSYNGSTWRYINSTESSGNLPSEGEFWTLLSAKGSDGGVGNTIDYIYRLSTSETVAPDLIPNDVDLPSGWSRTPLTTSPANHLWVSKGTLSPSGHIIGIWSPPTLFDIQAGTNGLDGTSSDLIFQAHNSPDNSPTPPNNSAIPGNNWSYTDPGTTSLLQYTWACKGVFDTTGTLIGNWSTPFLLSGRTGQDGANGGFLDRKWGLSNSFISGPTIDRNAFNPGSSWHDDPPNAGVGQYLFYTEVFKNADNTEKVPANALWSAPRRLTGDTGDVGPAQTFRGPYSNTVQYHGTNRLIEIVEYNNAYYMTNPDAGNITIGTLPTDQTKWHQFGASFESVATSLLLAEEAVLEHAVVRDLRTSSDNKRVEITAAGNDIKFYDNNGNRVIWIDDNVGNFGPGIQIDSSNQTDQERTYLGPGYVVSRQNNRNFCGLFSINRSTSSQAIAMDLSASNSGSGDALAIKVRRGDTELMGNLYVDGSIAGGARKTSPSTSRHSPTKLNRSDRVFWDWSSSSTRYIELPDISGLDEGAIIKIGSKYHNDLYIVATDAAPVRNGGVTIHRGGELVEIAINQNDWNEFVYIDGAWNRSNRWDGG